MYDVIVIGAGPAGLNAGLYCKRAGLNVLILDKYVAGGNLNNYPDIENVLGFGRIETSELLEKYFSHLIEFDVEMKEFEEVVSIHKETTFVVETADNTYESIAIILATGTTPRKLGIKGEEDFIGNGVHYCAVCDGALYKGKDVVVIGGGNSALENALYLADICNKVTILQNLDYITADNIIYERVKNNPKIEIQCSCNLNSIYKNGNDQIVLEYYIEKERQAIIDNGIFINIGLEPNSQLYKQLYEGPDCIQTDNKMQTQIPGVYAVGDVRNTQLRQVSTAIADGSIAAMSCADFIRKTKGV